MLSTWTIALAVTAFLVGVALVYLKKIRRRERAALDAPAEMVLTEDGRLTTVLPGRHRETDGTDAAEGAPGTNTGDSR